MMLLSIFSSTGTLSNKINLFFSPRILMVMELMEGGELFELVRTKRRFTEKEAVNFTKQVRLEFCSN